MTQPAVFSFGEPTPVLSGYDFLYTGIWAVPSSRYYEPPVDQNALAKLYRATAHHGSALQVKRNVLVKTFKPSAYLSRQDFSSFVMDYLIFGNAYLEKIYSRTGKLLALKPAKALYTKRGVQDGSYWWLGEYGIETEFKKDSVLHILEPDIRQDIYGAPDYLGALQSVLLSEASTLFRRRYYENGSHAGFILYMTDSAQQQEDIDSLRTALKDSKGVGNFRNLFMYAPNGKKDGLQLIPISEVAAKDDFANIKNVSRDDQLAGHRVPPQLMGIIPGNTGGFGDAEKAAMIFAANEIVPLQQRFLEVNDLLGTHALAFEPYVLAQ